MEQEKDEDPSLEYFPLVHSSSEGLEMFAKQKIYIGSVLVFLDSRRERTGDGNEHLRKRAGEEAKRKEG